MSRLPRPNIPLNVRLQVALRQLGWPQVEIEATVRNRVKLRIVGKCLKIALYDLACKIGNANLELHHRPALVNRCRKRNGEYDPPANDPDHLVYLAEDAHDVETRVRGQHGQHSDLALARKRKRRERKAKGIRVIRIPSANRWPPKGSQKIRSR